MENFRIEKLEEKYIEDVFLIEKTFFGLENSNVIESSLESETLDYYVLLDGEKVVGFYECSIILDEAELFDIAVREEYQGKKLSNILMNHLIENCRHRNVRTIFLEVNINNTKAINLYDKFGFKEYSRRKNYYGDSDAILMKLELV
ncbi:MAG: ribosomal protein S18-alanine N-acetyltransferase [Clostridia bacterium]|nr:ribosomal protein S18-alanine N-acetyltransferase [Clostridia bacterium]